MPAISERAKIVGIHFDFIVFPLSQELTNYLDDEQMKPKKIPSACQPSINLGAKSSPVITTATSFT